jgi:hypothetical protein
MAEGKTLLAIVELGGYPNFSKLYQQAGFEVITVNSMRKALSQLKKNTPTVIVAEFNFQSHFRDRTSNLESLLARIQHTPEIRLIVFYDKQYWVHLDKVQSRFSLHAALPFPIQEQQLHAALQRLGN